MASIVSIEIIPDGEIIYLDEIVGALIYLGDTVQYQALALYDDDTVVDITDLVIWSVSGSPEIAEFSLTTNGLLTSLETGKITVYVDYGSLSYSTTIAIHHPLIVPQAQDEEGQYRPSVDYYLGLITSQYQTSPKYLEWIRTYMEMIEDIRELATSLQCYFSLFYSLVDPNSLLYTKDAWTVKEGAGFIFDIFETSVGDQLDVIGVIVNQPRKLYLKGEPSVPSIFRWQRNTGSIINIPGAITDTWTDSIPGLYRGVIVYAGVITTQPVGGYVLNGDTITFTVAGSDGNLTRYSDWADLVVFDNPSDLTVDSGETASFSVNPHYMLLASMTGVTYQWQTYTTGWGDIGSATSSTYEFVASYPTDDGKRFRCVITTPTGVITTEEAVLTVNDSGAITYFSMVWPTGSGDLDGLVVDGTISPTFEEDIDESTIAANVELLLDGFPDSVVACTIVRDPDDHTMVVITPSSHLDFATDYILHINTGLRSTGGSHIDQEYIIPFKTILAGTLLWLRGDYTNNDYIMWWSADNDGSSVLFSQPKDVIVGDDYTLQYDDCSSTTVLETTNYVVGNGAITFININTPGVYPKITTPLFPSSYTSYRMGMWIRFDWALTPPYDYQIIFIETKPHANQTGIALAIVGYNGDMCSLDVQKSSQDSSTGDYGYKMYYPAAEFLFYEFAVNADGSWDIWIDNVLQTGFTGKTTIPIEQREMTCLCLKGYNGNGCPAYLDNIIISADATTSLYPLRNTVTYPG